MLSQDHQQTSGTNRALDDALTKLADVLRAMGVEELSVDDHYQHHTVNTDITPDKTLVDSFCKYITGLYASLQADK